MRRGILALAVTFAVGLAWAGEVGTRFEVGERASGVGWLRLSAELGAVSLSGRLEADLLCVCLRRGVFGARRSWGPLTVAGEGIVLTTGRLDASVSPSAKGLWRTEAGLFSARVGGRATVVDVLGGQFLTAAGSGFVRLDRDALWAELTMNTTWPGSPQVEGRVGLAGPAWVTLVASATGLGLELGAEQGPLSAQTYLSLSPTFQTITVGIAGGGVRGQARMTVRASDIWSASLSLSAAQGPWRGSITTSFLTSGLEKVTAEVRYTFGE